MISYKIPKLDPTVQHPLPAVVVYPESVLSRRQLPSGLVCWMLVIPCFQAVRWVGQGWRGMWRVGAAGRGCGGKVIEGWGGGGSEAESRDLNVKKKSFTGSVYIRGRSEIGDLPIMSESWDPPCHSVDARTKMASRMARAMTLIAQSKTATRGHIES